MYSAQQKPKDWEIINLSNPKPLHEVAGAVVQEPIADYKNRYINPLEDLKKLELERHVVEIFSEFEPKSSVLIFGSGHPGNVNFYQAHCPNVTRLGAVDFIFEAGLGLNSNIDFYCSDILSDNFSNVQVYDYVFTAHTVEHFTKENLFSLVLPRLCEIALEAVIVLVPYADNWKEEPSHRCRFYEDDEFAALAKKYKRIRDTEDGTRQGIEIVYWFEGRASKKD